VAPGKALAPCLMIHNTLTAVGCEGTRGFRRPAREGVVKVRAASERRPDLAGRIKPTPAARFGLRRIAKAAAFPARERGVRDHVQQAAPPPALRTREPGPLLAKVARRECKRDVLPDRRAGRRLEHEDDSVLPRLNADLCARLAVALPSDDGGPAGPQLAVAPEGANVKRGDGLARRNERAWLSQCAPRHKAEIIRQR
jgi:hypothetical protein